MNHKAGADFTEEVNVVQVDENNREREVSGPHKIEAWTGFNFPGRKGKYSEFEWNYNHFIGVDYDQKSNTFGVFKIIGENKDWSQGVSDEKGNYDFLMFTDIDHQRPDVKKNSLLGESG